MILISPKEKQLIQTNRSDILGSIWSSYNLDMQSNLGTIRVSPRMKLNTSSADDADLGLPVAFRNFDTLNWAICDTRIFSNSGVPQANFIEDASTGAQTDYSADESDMETFNGTLCATTTDALYSKAANGSGTGAWTARDTLNSNGQHVMCFFKKYNRLYYSNQSDNMLSIDESWSTADPGSDYAISLSGDSYAYTITSAKATSRFIYIGTIDKTKEGTVGKILEWDGISSQVSNEFPLAAQGCLAIMIDKERDIPFAMDSYGRLLKFNGNGFSEVGRLPISEKLLRIANDVDAGDRFIHPNGMMMTKNGTILVLTNNINADSSASINENFQAGIYEFTPTEDGRYSCVHRYSPSYTNTTTISDYGQTRLSKVGALASIDTYSLSATRNGTFLFGANYYSDATTAASGIFYDDSNDTLQKAGYFVTTKILAQFLKDIWQKIYVRNKKLLDSSDKVVLKYRTTEEDPTDMTITWSNDGNVFSTTSTGYAVGDEVEIVNGKGAGMCAHITAIETQGSTYFVTIDETVPSVTAGDTAKARYQSWIKIGSLANQTDELSEFVIGKASVWIQLKVWMRFAGKDELYDALIINKPHQLAQ